MGKDTGRWRRLRHSSALKKAVLALLAFLLVYSVTGFFILPTVLRSYLTNKLSVRLHRQVIIRQIKVNPFVLSVSVDGLKVKNRSGAGTFFSFDKLYVNLQSVSILKRALVIRDLRLVGPYLNIRRNPDLSYNFSDLLEKGPKKPVSSTPMRFSVNNIQIFDGSVDFFDGPKQVRHTVRKLRLTIPFISDIPYYTGVYVQPSAQALVNGKLISLAGRTKPFSRSLETSIDLHVKDLDLTHYLPYVPFKTDFRVPSGYLNVNTHIKYVQYKDRGPSLGLSGDVSLDDLRVEDRGGRPVAYFPKILMSIKSSELFARTAHLSRLVLTSPQVNVVRGRGGRVDILALLPKKKTGKTPGKKQPAPRIDADEMAIKNGRLVFTDRSNGGKLFHTRIEPVNMKISHFSTAPGKKAALELSLKTEANESLEVSGDFSVKPLSADGELKLENVPLRKYGPYYGKAVRFEIAGGKMGLFESRFSYEVPEGPGEEKERLSDMSLSVEGLKLKRRHEKKDFLDLPVFSMKGTDVDLLKKVMVIGEVETRKGMVAVDRRKDGTLNIGGLFARPPEGRAGETRPVRAGAPQAWLITLKKVFARGFAVRMSDMKPASPVNYSISRISLDGRNISTARGSRGSVLLRCRMGGRGSLKVRATVGINPLAVRARLDLNRLDIVPFQPYFTNRVKILVTGGDVSAGGDISLRYSAGKVAASYKGEATLSRFNSLDKARGDEFLKWGSLHLGGLSASYGPLNLHIDKVALTDFYSRLIIEQNGVINLRDIFLKPAAAGPPASRPQGRAAPGPVRQAVSSPVPRMIQIRSVTMQGGTINFTDRHIKPNYSANLLDIGGRISGLSSVESAMADVDLIGKLDNYAPLEITGKINPLRKDLYVDLKIDFKDMDLSSLTPYSGRHIGYTIRKGKLFLSMQYLIVKKKLDAQNHIFLDQLTLGDKVESPVATRLPVRLAIALLKDRNGDINLDVPVSGYINDPKFSLGRIILKVIVNLLVKAATSPFSLLSKIFGGGADLSHVEFAPGMAAISADQAKKLDSVVKALYERPSLQLEIEGHVDPEKDREGLRQYLFQREIKFQKWKEMSAKGGPTVPVDEVQVSKEEYPTYLKKAYKAAKFPKPRNILGFVKGLPVPEMEKLMLTNIQVTDNELRALAVRRAKAVKDYILKSGQVDPKRVFLVEAKTPGTEKKEKLSGGRVDLKLK